MFRSKTGEKRENLKLKPPVKSNYIPVSVRENLLPTKKNKRKQTATSSSNNMYNLCVSHLVFNVIFIFFSFLYFPTGFGSFCLCIQNKTAFGNVCNATAAVYVQNDGHATQSPSDLVTQTVYGFLDFTTTIGNTVMVFSPQSAPPPGLFIYIFSFIHVYIWLHSISVFNTYKKQQRERNRKKKRQKQNIIFVEIILITLAKGTYTHIYMQLNAIEST